MVTCGRRYSTQTLKSSPTSCSDQLFYDLFLNQTKKKKKLCRIELIFPKIVSEALLKKIKKVPQEFFFYHLL